MRKASSSSSVWFSAGILGASLALAALIPGGLAKLGYPALGLFSLWAFWKGWPAKTALLGWLGLAFALGSSAPPVPARILLPASGFGLLAWLSIRDRRALSFALLGFWVKLAQLAARFLFLSGHEPYPADATALYVTLLKARLGLQEWLYKMGSYTLPQLASLPPRVHPHTATGLPGELALLWPLSFLPHPAFVKLWYALAFLSVAAGGLLVYRKLKRPWLKALALALPFSYNLSHALYLSNPSVWCVGLVAAALFGPRPARGPALGVATLIKPTLGLALAFGWFSEDRRSFWAGLGAVAGFSLLALPLAGVAGHLNWWETFTGLSSFQFTLENFHLGSPLYHRLGLPAALALALQEGFGLIVLTLALWKAWRFKNWPVSVSLGIIAGYYVSAFLWDHHLLYGIPAFLSLAQVHPWFSAGLAAAWPITAPLGMPWLWVAYASLLLLPLGLYFLNEGKGNNPHRGRARQNP